MTEDSDTSYTDSSGSSASSEHYQTRKRKRSVVNTSDSNEALHKRIEVLEKIVSQVECTQSKAGKVVNNKTPTKNTPKNDAKATRRSIPQRNSSSDSNNASTSTDALQYDCKLCEGKFKSKQARNIHYTGTHKVENEKLLFFPDGTGLVKSSLEHHIKSKPDYLKTAARKMSSRVCKLCKVELDMDDLKWHYEDAHKVIQMRKVTPLICLDNSDIKIVAEPYRCEYCPRTFDDESWFKRHVLTHGDKKGEEINCKFCKRDFKRNLYNVHVRKQHPEMYFKSIGTGANANCDVNTNESHRKTVAEQEKYKRAPLKFSCHSCSFKCSSLVTLTGHKLSVHKNKERQNKTNEETTKCQNINVTPDNREIENKKRKDSEVNSTSEHNGNHIPMPNQAIMMYICEACDLATTSYDEAVSHSQDHILNTVNNDTMLCEQCNLKFGSDYETHKQLHEVHSELDIDSFQCVIFDYKLLFTDKWLDMFDFLPKVKIKIIAGDHSVYFSTRCIRFKWPGCMNNSSAPFFLFQCVTCRNYVDPYSIESHVQQQSCSVESNSYPCEKCPRPFYSEVARIQHSYTHRVPDAESKYRTILFNNQSDLEINELLLKTANKSVPKKKNDVITTGNVATQVDPNNQSEDSQIADKTKENNDPCGPEKLTTVYKCRCGLCFHTLSHVYDHLQRCSNTFKVETVTCKCGLVFDSQHYPLHYKVHFSYTTILVKEITIKPVSKINIRGMVEEFKKDILTQKGKTELVDKVITANYIKPSNVMVDDNYSQELTYEKDKTECMNKSNKLPINENCSYCVAQRVRGATQHTIKENLANPEFLSQDDQNKSPPKIGSGTENPKKPIIQRQYSSERTDSLNESEKSAEKPDDIIKNKRVVSNDDIKKVISLYNYIKDAMKNKTVIVVEPTKVTENNNESNSTSDGGTWSNNARNKEENKSLVATTIEVEAQHQCGNIVKNNAKENTSVKISQPCVNTELEDEVAQIAREKHNHTTTQDMDDPNIKKDSNDFKRNSLVRESIDTFQTCRQENEAGWHFENSALDEIKSEPVESEITAYDEEELLKDDEEDYMLCPDIVDLLTDDED